MKLSIIDRVWEDVKPSIRRVHDYAPPEIWKKTRKRVIALKKTRKQIKLLSIGKGICFFLIYVSLFSAVIGDFFLVSDALKIVSRVGGILGTSALLGILALLNWAATLKEGDAHTYASFTISAGVMVDKTYTQEQGLDHSILLK